MSWQFYTSSGTLKDGAGAGSVISAFNDIEDVDVSAAVDGSLVRYESGSVEWQATTGSTLLISDAGQLQVPTTGATAGLLLGGDAQLYRSAANIISVGSGDKLQQSAAPTVADDLTNKDYVDTAVGAGVSVMNDLTDVDTSGVVDGALIRYESTGTTWADTSTLLFSDAGQLQVTTTGSGAGILLGGDAQLYRSAANIVSLGSGDKIQQADLPTTANDLTNQVWVERMDMFYA